MNEIYLYKKVKKQKNAITLGISYPSTYYYGMSVLGFLSFFKEFDKNENVLTQRIFLNSKTLAFEPQHLDLLGFSCIFELDIFQVFKILDKYGINIEASKRGTNAPLIFAGGPVMTSNPEPFADFFDFITIGDGEKMAQEITSVYIANKNKSKKELLKELSKIKGIYVPSLYKPQYIDDDIISFMPTADDISEKVTKRTAENKKCLYSPIISDETFYADTVFIELGRGCSEKCRFCSASWQNLPCRYPELEHIKKAIKKASRYAKRIVFIGAMITMHPDFDEICMYISKLKLKRNFDVEFSSVSLNKKSELLSQIITDKTIFLSIESADETFRKQVGKDVSDTTILDTIEFYAQRGITKFNLYFLIGLPNEPSDNTDKLISFANTLKTKYPNQKFVYILSTFTPKPHTPFEASSRQSNADLKDSLEKIKSYFDTNKIEAVYPVLHNDNFNTLISLADRRIAPVIKYLYKKKLPVSKTFIEYRKYIAKFNAKKNKPFKIPHYAYYCYRNKDDSTLLPWNFIEFN